MAERKKSKSLVLTKLVPKSITVIAGGQEVVVATDKYENAVMNMVLASQMRAMIQTTIQNFKDDDVKLTPKEIRDLAGAARDIAAFSMEIYEKAEPIENKNEKQVEPATATDISFDDLSKPPEIKVNGEEGNTPKSDSSGSVPSP